ncbi:TPA: hypothetical protein ACE6P7_001783 [Neisseria gonorrhoeae]
MQKQPDRRQAANLAASLCRPKALQTAFFFDFVGGMVDFERVHVYYSYNGTAVNGKPNQAGTWFG